jgi:hypothetical protein
MTVQFKVAIGISCAVLLGMVILGVLAWFPAKEKPFDSTKWPPAGPKAIERSGSEVTPEQIKEANEAVSQMLEAGAVRVDKAAGKAWISPLVWMHLNTDAKDGCGAALAIYCSPHDPAVEIYDAQSAKKIASWDWAKGLEEF